MAIYLFISGMPGMVRATGYVDWHECFDAQYSQNGIGGAAGFSPVQVSK